MLWIDPPWPRPVELVSLSASGVETGIELIWETGFNSYEFEVQRSSSLFSHMSKEKTKMDWEKIGFVGRNGINNSINKYSFIDRTPTSGGILFYRIKQINYDGQVQYSDVAEVSFMPTEYILYQNYPNPFNPTTNIIFSIPEDSKVIINLYNLVGEEVTEIVNKSFTTGYHELMFNASGLAGGVYFYRITAGSFTDVKKLMLLK